MPDEPDDDYSPLLARRRKRRARAKRRMLIVAVVCGVALFGIGGFVLFKKLGRPGGISVVSNGEDWTHRELYEHLQKRGVRCDMERSRHVGTAYLFRTDINPEYATAMGDEGHIMIAEGVVSFEKAGQSPFEKQNGTDAARRIVGEYPPDTAIFNWGPWIFRGDRKLLAQIKSALGAK